jgi:hypothetical protein
MRQEDGCFIFYIDAWFGFKSGVNPDLRVNASLNTQLMHTNPPLRIRIRL